MAIIEGPEGGTSAVDTQWSSCEIAGHEAPGQSKVLCSSLRPQGGKRGGGGLGFDFSQATMYHFHGLVDTIKSCEDP